MATKQTDIGRFRSARWLAILCVGVLCFPLGATTDIRQDAAETISQTSDLLEQQNLLSEELNLVALEMARLLRELTPQRLAVEEAKLALQQARRNTGEGAAGALKASIERYNAAVNLLRRSGGELDSLQERHGTIANRLTLIEDDLQRLANRIRQLESRFSASGENPVREEELPSTTDVAVVAEPGIIEAPEPAPAPVAEPAVAAAPANKSAEPAVTDTTTRETSGASEPLVDPMAQAAVTPEPEIPVAATAPPPKVAKVAKPRLIAKAKPKKAPTNVRRVPSPDRLDDRQFEPAFFTLQALQGLNIQIIATAPMLLERARYWLAAPEPQFKRRKGIRLAPEHPEEPPIDITLQQISEHIFVGELEMPPGPAQLLTAEGRWPVEINPGNLGQMWIVVWDTSGENPILWHYPRMLSAVTLPDYSPLR